MHLKSSPEPVRRQMGTSRWAMSSSKNNLGRCVEMASLFCATKWWGRGCGGEVDPRQLKRDAQHRLFTVNRDPYIIHLTLPCKWWFPLILVKSHVSNGQMYLLRSPGVNTEALRSGFCLQAGRWTRCYNQHPRHRPSQGYLRLAGS